MELTAITPQIETPVASINGYIHKLMADYVGYMCSNLLDNIITEPDGESHIIFSKYLEDIGMIIEKFENIRNNNQKEWFSEQKDRYTQEINDVLAELEQSRMSSMYMNYKVNPIDSINKDIKSLLQLCIKKLNKGDTDFTDINKKLDRENLNRLIENYDNLIGYIKSFQYIINHNFEYNLNARRNCKTASEELRKIFTILFSSLGNPKQLSVEMFIEKLKIIEAILPNHNNIFDHNNRHELHELIPTFPLVKE